MSATASHCFTLFARHGWQGSPEVLALILKSPSSARNGFIHITIATMEQKPLPSFSIPADDVLRHQHSAPWRTGLPWSLLCSLPSNKFIRLSNQLLCAGVS